MFLTLKKSHWPKHWIYFQVEDCWLFDFSMIKCFLQQHPEPPRQCSERVLVRRRSTIIFQLIWNQWKITRLILLKSLVVLFFNTFLDPVTFCNKTFDGSLITLQYISNFQSAAWKNAWNLYCQNNIWML